MFKSTTNFLLITATFASISFIIINIYTSFLWIKIELDPILISYFGMIVAFLIWKKGAKKDWASFTKEQKKKIEKKEDVLENWIEEEKIDALLGIDKK
jgi:amino acid permease